VSNGFVKARADCARAAGHYELEVPTVNDGMSWVVENAARVMPEQFGGAIVAGLDVHLRQITFDCLDTATGEVIRGADRGDPGSGRGVGCAVPGS
jgi:hypothetical protein